jgi:pyrroline-5-carboxylate reductase
MSAGMVVLVGCGQMGSAMLRGWLKSGAASRFVVVEPSGVPEALASSTHVVAYRAASELGDTLAPDAVVFAVKPQAIGDIVPAYRRFARPETVFMSIAAGTTIANLTRSRISRAISATRRSSG